MYRVDVWQHAWQLNGSNSNKNWSSLVFITRKIPKDCNVLHRISTKYIHTCIVFRFGLCEFAWTLLLVAFQHELNRTKKSNFRNVIFCFQELIHLKMLKKSLFWVKTVFEIGGRTQTNKKRSGNLNREFVSPTYELHRYSKSNSYKLITVPFFLKACWVQKFQQLFQKSSIKLPNESPNNLQNRVLIWGQEGLQNSLFGYYARQVSSKFKNRIW